MEEAANDTQKTDVGFPEVTRTKKKSFGVLALVVLSLLIAGFFVYSIVWGGETKDRFMKDDVETVIEEETNEEVTPEPTEKVLGKKDIKVSILNGSGIPGSASELEKKIAALGFVTIETGNADSYDYKTTKVTFGPTVSDEVQAEVLTELKKIYTTVDSEEKAVSGFDMQIVIGGKSAQATPTPTSVQSSVTPTKTPTPQATSTPSVTPTI